MNFGVEICDARCRRRRSTLSVRSANAVVNFARPRSSTPDDHTASQAPVNDEYRAHRAQRSTDFSSQKAVRVRHFEQITVA